VREIEHTNLYLNHPNTNNCNWSPHKSRSAKRFSTWEIRVLVVEPCRRNIAATPLKPRACAPRTCLTMLRSLSCRPCSLAPRACAPQTCLTKLELAEHGYWKTTTTKHLQQHLRSKMARQEGENKVTKARWKMWAGREDAPPNLRTITRRYPRAGYPPASWPAHTCPHDISALYPPNTFKVETQVFVACWKLGFKFFVSP
jgi:hypothetical protein